MDFGKESCDLTLHIVLATIPQNQEKLFNNNILKDYYYKYRDDFSKYCLTYDNDYLYSKNDTNKTTKVLYEPLRYYILGNYDIAYVSLIDNFKFAQRLFEPEFEINVSEKQEIFSPHTFQSITGINNYNSDFLKNLFYSHLRMENLSKKYFLCISNLKLNNGLLIGNGEIFHNSVVEKIKSYTLEFNSKLENENVLEVIVLDSFSWFEITVLVFSNQINDSTDFITDLRKLALGQIENKEQIAQQSLYYDIASEPAIGELYQTNLFADTHSYFGINSDLIEAEEENSWVKQFLESIKISKVKTEIEWQVKPGHLQALLEYLKGISAHNNLSLNFNERFFLTGKTDYLIQETSDSLYTNFQLIKILIRENCEIFKYVRKIKTKLLFPRPERSPLPIDKYFSKINLELKKIGKTGVEIKNIDDKLKSLKISREIRWKIIKIYANFNNGIQDIILFPFFLDFKIFIEDLVGLVDDEYDVWVETESKAKISDEFSKSISAINNSIGRLENKLMKRIAIFQEGYNIRMLNSYQFEDINDFDLDFNSSLQQLLSAYNTIVIDIGNVLYPSKLYEYGPIVLLNLKDTLGNYNSINYYIHHLISPEFVFATITKEILNNDEFDTKIVTELLVDYKKLVNDIIKDEDIYIYDYIVNDIIDIKYLINDSVRVANTYNFNFELFYYWFWNYSLQNTVLYDKSGLLNEKHFIKELFRILFIARFYNVELQTLKCPIAELQTHWDRYYDKITLMAIKFTELLKYRTDYIKRPILEQMYRYVIKRFNKLNDYLIPDDIKIDFELTHDNNYEMLLNLQKIYKIELTKLHKYLIKEAIFFNLNKIGEDDRAKEGSLLYLQWYMLKYLKNIYEMNNKEVTLLKRNWFNGTPLVSFLKWRTYEGLYSIDQTGGLFFTDLQRMNQYMMMSCDVIKKIISYSQISKKFFILHYLNSKNNE